LLSEIVARSCSQSEDSIVELATYAICWEKKIRRGECLLTLSTLVVSGDQDTGRSNRGIEPEEPTESQGMQERRLCASKREGTVIGFYHKFIFSEITKHSILKDTLRDRQTSWATFLFREE
jgi:hypothetical protein